MLSADQLLARLYSLRKDYADDPAAESYQAPRHPVMDIQPTLGASRSGWAGTGGGSRVARARVLGVVGGEPDVARRVLIDPRARVLGGTA